MSNLMKVVGVLLILVSINGCTDNQGTVEVLTANGYTKISTLGYGVFACSDTDIFATKFTAISPNGTRVSGTVCKGLLKGKTIRF